jgi:very-short-patch-repair endonuclease
VIVELDGGQHALHKKQDREREAALADSGFEVMRFWNTEVLKNLDGVLEQIRECCFGSESPRTLTPLDGGSRDG